MKINLVCVEDGIIALGFRKMAALVKSLGADATSHYVPLSRRSMWRRISGGESAMDSNSEARLRDGRSTSRLESMPDSFRRILVGSSLLLHQTDEPDSAAQCCFVVGVCWRLSGRRHGN